MLREVLEAFQPLKVSCYLDCTLGAGGHAAAMVSAHPVRVFECISS
jgi:16S rRNA (cytosine1402-N4)-methyltransferase